jgi:hypothetical protein
VEDKTKRRLGWLMIGFSGGGLLAAASFIVAAGHGWGALLFSLLITGAVVVLYAMFIVGLNWIEAEDR